MTKKKRYDDTPQKQDVQCVCNECGKESLAHPGDLCPLSPCLGMLELVRKECETEGCDLLVIQGKHCIHHLEESDSTPNQTPIPTPPILSWKAEVIADDSGKWCGNGLRFKSESSALSYVVDLSLRWTAVREVRVVPSTEEPNR